MDGITLIIVSVVALLTVILLALRHGSIASPGSGLPVLVRYSRDLTRMARLNQLDPVIGRQSEIAQVVQILSRRNKNNPVLIGAAGVGKTALAEGLALAIIARQVPPTLYNKRVLALDLPGILAGTKYRGEFEQRLKKVTEEIVSSKRTIILFIDEIHILAEAGDAEGAINAADILKPLLARGDLQVVGATTPEEYLEFIKKDKTLDRRLHPVFVSEPTPAQTRQILDGIKGTYETYHDVTISAAALDAAVSVTRTLAGRSYPDKAIDAIDEACSKVHIDHINRKKTQSKKSRVAAKLSVSANDVKQVVASWKHQQ
ncbi:MAG: ATP-dependent Clp protease ATP-binding subunit [Candidatus Buchananbacteria bacterium]|nr:ATP-dependent Clp protease ATP-binding subunit [Candidatus Buchananbacteria bacterium]